MAGDLPALFGNVANSGEGFRCEYIVIFGCDDKQNIVILGVRVLQIFKSQQLRIFLAEK